MKQIEEPGGMAYLCVYITVHHISILWTLLLYLSTKGLLIIYLC